MPFVVKCSACGKRYQVGDQLAGKQIKCQACQAGIDVPTAGSSPSPAAAEPELDLGFSSTAGADDLLGLLGEQKPLAPRPVAAPASGGPSLPRFAAPVAQPTQAGSPMLLEPLPSLPTAMPGAMLSPGTAMIPAPNTLPSLPTTMLPSTPTTGLTTLRRPPSQSTWQRSALLWGGVVALGLAIMGGIILSSWKGKADDAGSSLVAGAANTGSASRPSPAEYEQGQAKVDPARLGDASTAPSSTPTTSTTSTATPATATSPPSTPSAPRSLTAPSTDGGSSTSRPSTPAERAQRTLTVPSRTPGDPATQPRPGATGSAPGDLSSFAPAEGTGVAGGSSGFTSTAIDWRVVPEQDLPPVEYRAGWKLTIPVDSGNGAIFAPDPSSVVGVHSGYGDRGLLEIWHLPTGKRVADMRGAFPLNFEESALSPDGKLMVGPSNATTSSELIILDLKAERAVGRIPVLTRFHSVRFTSFAGNNRIVTNIIQPNHLTLLEAPSGKEVAAILIGELPSGYRTIAVSPGGKYLAVCLQRRISVYATETGESLGEITGLPSDRCKGMAFSNDGLELAVVTNEYKLMVWNLGDGEQILAHDLSGERDHISGGSDDAPLQWLPERMGWLVDSRAIIERSTGKAVWALPKTHGSHPGARVLPNYHIFALSAGSPKALVNSVLPMDKLALAAKSLQMGGDAIDAALPPLTEAKIVDVPVLPLSSTSAWKVEVDPAPEPRGALATRPIELKSTPREIDTICFTGPEAAVAFVGGVKSVDRVDREVQPGWCERYDLVAGRMLSRHDLPHSSRLIAASLDGTQMATVSGEALDRIDVWLVDGNKHVCGLRPYLHLEHKQDRYQIHKRTVRTIRWSAFVGNNHLLTLSDGRQLILWSIPDGKAVYVIDNVGGTRPIYSNRDRSQAGNPLFTPGGKYLALVTETAINFIEPLTGAPVGSLVLPKLARVDAMGTSFHPQGLRLCVTQGDTLLVYDTARGELIGDLSLPEAEESVQWVSNEHLLFGTDLYDLTRQSVVWQYNNASYSQAHVESPAHLRKWHLSTGIAGQTAYLCGAQLPDDVAKSFIETMIPAGVAPLLTKGSKVRLEVNFGSEGSDRIAEHLRSQLAARGMQVADEAPYVLRVSTETIDTKSVEYSRYGSISRTSERVSVSVTRLRCEVTVVDSNQKLLWRRYTEVGGYAPHLISSSETARYENAHWEQARAYFMAVRLPREVYLQPRSADGKVLGVGSSKLTANGPVMEKEIEQQ